LLSAGSVNENTVPPPGFDRGAHLHELALALLTHPGFQPA